MSKKDNGGLAFPVSVAMPDGSVAVERGMSLRDYFAAKAMQGMLAASNRQASDEHMFARDAYTMADAMLSERAK